MRQTIERFIPQTIEELENVKKRLRECKPEWLEKKPGRGNNTYMGHNTMRQILDHAVSGITYWDFEPVEQWREEVYAFNKQTNSWNFDGYVYHVKAYMFIPGIGHRGQYGCKVAVGGKDNQDSAYKSATSNAFTKCASMFGVGEEIYSKIKVELEAEQEDVAYEQIQQNPNYYVQNQNQQQSQHQNNFNQYNNWNQGNQQNNQYQQNQYEQQNYNNGFQQQNNFHQQNQSIEQSIQETDQAFANGQIGEAPFENVQQNHNGFQAQPNGFQAQEQGQAQAQNYEAQPKEFGAPAGTAVAEPQVQSQPQEQSQPANPWQEQGVIQQLQRYATHKQRLGIQNDEQMVSYLRDHFKDGNATVSYLTPETLKGFNDHLENIQV